MTDGDGAAVRIDARILEIHLQQREAAQHLAGEGLVDFNHVHVLERAKLSLKDLDIIEINEAFASQVLGCLALMKVDFKDPRVNPNGGAIAIGHPLGCSGARLALTVSRQLQESGSKYAAVSLCIGVGQGLAMIIERQKN